MLVLCYLAAMTFWMVDALWAAGSKKRQALHDIAARTNVGQDSLDVSSGAAAARSSTDGTK